MHFIDDDHIEVVSRQVGEAVLLGIEGLHRGEDAFKTFGRGAVNPDFAEVSIAQDMPKRGARLVQDFLAVGDKQKAGFGVGRAIPLEIEGGDHGFARARGGDN